jgi:N-acetyl-beta-hexosaminidase
MIRNQTFDLIPPELTDADESYNLTVEDFLIKIEANQYSGAVRGLATLSQLVKYSESTGRFTYKIDFSPI